MNDIKVDDELDCRGLTCPLPILKTKKAIEKLSKGQVLKMISSDPGSAKDLPSWSERTGNKILKEEKEGSDFIFYVERK